ncbi:beta-galactosidase [Anaerosacchariphilus polymeriproducens]|uniref:Beta-galactosidase n=1 Tax=Anaerosacchariphilus polymeriproducens TaxID=1812858 RepID=A0A371AW32_9FIRM|nr:beta-galactosidase [Anaerosacchariphilus polymeriproducens]RDU23804.1 beta-galactosidase [Anaerosacchariphilus polymeriproducens]
MIENPSIKSILYGGDYNPEQWPETIWHEDMRLLSLANINVVTLNVFSWASLQEDETTYHFEKLDRIMEIVKKNGLSVCLATSTAVHPAWMARKYPEVLRTEFNGMKRKFGSRHNSCPNSPIYRKYSVELARRLAERYKDYDNIIAWHISNEFGGECYCENCENAFREWLKNRYHTIDEVNRAWNTAFWGHTFYTFEDIVSPNLLSEHFDYDRTTYQPISLDYRRFMSDSLLTCYQEEAKAIRTITPNIPITTNLMGFYKLLDYHKWAKSMDFISWDNYPAYDNSPSSTAMAHDLMRGLKQGKPFALMEQTPSVTNWHPYNALKRPGQMRLLSYQAVAHGADTIMFFQMRRSIGACEKYHGAVIDHAGHENTRVFREVASLGQELRFLGDTLLGSRIQAKAAIIFDWDNWWSVDFSAGPSCLLKYYDIILHYYTAFHTQHIPVDIISVEDELCKYDVVIAPLLYMTKAGSDDKIRTFVKNGGTFMTTFFSGYVNENDLVITGGYPGRLRDILGIWVEEEDALIEGEENSFTYEGITYPARIICDLLHSEGAEILCSYEKDFYSGMPVITCNHFGKGLGYYMGTISDLSLTKTLLRKLCKEKQILPIINGPEHLEVSIRENVNGKFLFLLNHNSKEISISLPYHATELLSKQTYQVNDALILSGYAIKILKLL